MNRLRSARKRWLGCAAMFFVVMFSREHLVSGQDEETSDRALPPSFHVRTFEDAEGPHRYGLFLPQGYSPEKKWPIVLFLHGAGEKGTDGIQPMSVGLGPALEANPSLPFIAVFPQSENVRSRHLTGWLAGGAQANRALQILEDVEANYSVDPTRRTLVGWSMGGYGAWNLAAARPELWRGVLALSGGELDPGLDLSALARSAIPVWAIHGEKDELVHAEKSTEIVNRLNQAGGNGAVTLVEMAGHNVWREAFADARVLNWLTAPDVATARSITDLTTEHPLPMIAKFYVAEFMKWERIQNKLAVRLGNRVLSVIADGISELLPPTALQGELEEITRRFNTPDGEIQITLSDVTFNGQLAQCRLEAISGGRFLANFELAPLRLSIGQAALKFNKDFARTGPFSIDLGNQRPVQLSIEFQPTIEESGLRLIPLRQHFSIADDNWFISPPEVTHLESQRFSKANIVTGIVGGLYLRKSEIEEAVLGVVPTMLDVVQSELKTRDAPRLAKLLWPLPALVPILSISPSQVQTDRDGVSIVLDMLVLVNKSAPPPSAKSSSEETFSVGDLPTDSQLDFLITLDSLQSLSRISITQGLAHINVLDVQDAAFDRLASSKTLQQIFEGFPTAAPAEDWDVGLSMLEPFSLTNSNQKADTGSTIVSLIVPRIAFEAVNRHSGQTGQVVFSMTQQLKIEPVLEHGQLQAMQVSWLADPIINVLETEWEHPVNEAQFCEILKQTWSDWTARTLNSTRPLPTLKFGRSQLQLETFSVDKQSVRLRFLESPNP